MFKIALHNDAIFPASMECCAQKRAQQTRLAKQNITVILSPFRDCLNVLTIGCCDA